jgi:hypothetical protein
MKHKVDGIDNAYCVISHHYRDEDISYVYRTELSYFLDLGDGFGVDWEPDSGPFTLLVSVDKDHKEAKKHWFFDYIDGYHRWAQLVVEECGIHANLLNGDLKAVFNKLYRYGIHNKNYEIDRVKGLSK